VDVAGLVGLVVIAAVGRLPFQSASARAPVAEPSDTELVEGIGAILRY